MIYKGEQALAEVDFFINFKVGGFAWCNMIPIKVCSYYKMQDLQSLLRTKDLIHPVKRFIFILDSIIFFMDVPSKNKELFYGDWHGTYVPSGTVESNFFGPLIKRADQSCLFSSML
jgi:hypothetical protein